MKNVGVFILMILVEASSCSNSKIVVDHHAESCGSNYIIIYHSADDLVNKDSALIVGEVYDSCRMIPNSTCLVYTLDYGSKAVRPDSIGRFRLNVKSGNQQIEIISVGNDAFITDSIQFVGGNIYSVKFYLGWSWID